MKEVENADVSPEGDSLDKKKAKTKRDRQRLLDNIASGAVKKLQDQVAYVLSHFPETRNSDTKLGIQVVKSFYSQFVDAENKVSLAALQELPKFYDMQRYRAKIQNDYGLFLADPKIQAFRQKRSKEAREQLVSEGRIASDLRIFADESGKSGKDDQFIIIGSFWVYGNRDWEFLVQRFHDWRYAKNTRKEFHFNKISQHEAAKEAISFFQEAVFQGQLTSFTAVAIERRGIPQPRMSSAIYESFAELVIKGIQAEFESGRISPPVSLEIHKDADSDTDVLEVAKMERRIEEGLRAVFSNKEAALRKVSALDSAIHDLIQIADLFTSAINRWVNVGIPSMQGNAKEYLAYQIGSLMGFDISDGKLKTPGDFCKVIYYSVNEVLLRSAWPPVTMASMKKEHVKLSHADRAALTDLLARGSLPAKAFKRATGLLELNRGKTLQAVAATLGVNYNTVAAWRDRYQQVGLQGLQDQPRSGRPITINGKQRAKLTALACSDAPTGHARWSLRLLADKVVELGHCDAISHTQVGNILKKTRSNRT